MHEALRLARCGDRDLHLLPRMANRHGLITGATGTGKTVTLQTLAEGFSRIGVPVFLADVKGDLAGLAQPGGDNPRVAERIAQLGLRDVVPEGSPVILWDVFGEAGHPVRATIADMGPLLLARMLALNDTQAGVLSLAFEIADDAGLLLLDLKDLQALLRFVGDNARQFTTQYGTIAAATVGAIQRALLGLEQQGGGHLFGEPMLAIDDLMRTVDGRGVINILAADRLLEAPRVYATLLLWLLSELFERLPEVGDQEAPRLVVFFDEAHLLFADAPRALVDKIEQTVRLIRSKAVGVFFVTQAPDDIPAKVAGQLGNRVQHALRAYSARDQKAVRAAAETLRENPALDEVATIGQLGVGEALVSLLDEAGHPGVVERAWIVPPRSRLGPLTAAERQAILARSPLAGVYEQSTDRESAYEKLRARAERLASEPPVGEADAPRRPRRGRPRESVVEALAKSAARSVGTQLGRALVRGLLGSLLGGRR